MPRAETTAKTRAQNVTTAERAAACLELRKAGASYTEVGRAVGISRTHAHRLVVTQLRQMRENTAELADELRELELARLDSLLRTAIQIAKDASETPENRLKAVNTSVRLSESRRKLLGLDAPERMEHSGSVVAVPLQQFREEVATMSDAEIERELAAFQAGAEAQAAVTEGRLNVAATTNGSQLPSR